MIKMTNEETQTEKITQGCGKEISVRKGRRTYKRICGGFIQYGSKRKNYCEDCELKQRGKD